MTRYCVETHLRDRIGDHRAFYKATFLLGGAASALVSEGYPRNGGG